MRTTGIRQTIEIAKRVNENLRDKRPEYATVTRVDGTRVDLRVGLSNTAIRNAEVIGDPSQLVPGQRVQIAWWDNRRPVAIASVSLDDHETRIADLERRLAAINISTTKTQPTHTGGLSHWEILRFSGGALASVHEPSESGMNDALGLCIHGDVILLPAIELVMDFTMPSGATVTGVSREAAKINGQVTMTADSALEALSVNHRSTTSSQLNAVVAPSSGSANIQNCNVWAFNCGDGDAAGLMSGNGNIRVRNSEIVGESVDGDGYAVVGGSGTTTLQECDVYGSTDTFSNDTNIEVYGTVVGVTRTDCVADPGETLVVQNLPSMSPAFPLPKSGNLDMTLDGVSSLTSYKIDTPPFTNDILASANYYYLISGSQIYRGSWSGNPSHVMDLVSGGGYMRWCLASDNDIFATRNGSGSLFELRLVRYNLSNVSSQILRTWEYPRTQDGQYIYNETMEASSGVFCGYVDDDLRILQISLAYNSATAKYLQHIVVYDVGTDTVLLDTILDLGAAVGESFSTSPGRFYGNKFCYMVNVSGSPSKLVAVVIDIENGTANKYDYTPGTYTNAGARLNQGAMDVTNGRYYFLLHEYIPFSENYFVKASYFSLASNTFTVGTYNVRRINDSGYGEHAFFVQGRDTCFLVDGATSLSTSSWEFRSASGATLHFTFPGTVTVNNRNGNYISQMYDDESGRVWKYSFDDETLDGYDLSGSKSSITISGDLPCPQVINSVQYTNVWIFNGKAIARVWYGAYDETYQMWVPSYHRLI